VSAPLLRIGGLVIEFDTAAGRRRVVDGVDVELAEGEVLGILGESGSGKTMTTMAVLGLVAGRPGVVSGEIELRDGSSTHRLLEGLDKVVRVRPGAPVRKDDRRWQRMVHRRMRPLWGRVVTAVFQNPRQSLDPLMSVGTQVEEAVRVAEPSLAAGDVRRRAIEWLERVHMNDPERVFRSHPHELSGGMCQRAMIAIALACRPRLLIADEPTTGLDSTVRAEIVALFRELMADRRRSMLYISHDVREVLHLADRVIVMRHGRVLETAASTELRDGVGRRAEYTASLLSAAGLVVGQGDAA
jgi:ABC-type dipeptide/oligopeptide/nickel transport system ATPase component